MKKFIVFSLFVILFSACQNETKPPSALNQFIPSQTALILESDDLNELSEKINENSFSKANANLPFFSYLEDKLNLIADVELNEESYISFSKVGRKEIATTLITKQQLIDAAKDIKKFTYDGLEIHQQKLGKNNIFISLLNDTYIASTSKLVIEDVIRKFNNDLPTDKDFEKIQNTTSSKHSLYINHQYTQQLWETLLPNLNNSYTKRLSLWTAVDIYLSDKSIQLTGVSQAPDSSYLLNLFKGNKPQKSEIATITPLNARGFFSFTYSDYEKLQLALEKYRNKDLPDTNKSIYNHANEIGIIYFSQAQAVALNTLDADNDTSILPSLLTAEKKYRGIPMFRFSKPQMFYQDLYPLITQKNLNYACKIDDFYVFAEKKESLENIIANYQNTTVLGSQAYYENLTTQLTEKASMLLIGINENLKLPISKTVDAKWTKNYNKIKFNNYKLNASQWVYEHNFAHLNFLLTEADANQVSNNAVVQINNIKVPEKLLSQPIFFTNWKTKTKDIAIQGVSNTLYMYNYKGELRWKKALDGRILGDIQEIDIYSNGRLQMAFATQDKVYILTKDGKEVSPFPLSFKDKITQPLAVFDYDNNGKYRFLVTQNNNVLMYDKEGKNIKGFKFETTKSNIKKAPKHIRIGKKDYIIIPEENGKLHIVNRVGKTRVPVKEQITFSNNEWYLYKNKFTSTNKKGELIQVDQEGKLQASALNLAENHSMVATPKSLAHFSENTLTIKGKNINVDYGLYSKIAVFYIDNKLYFSITDTQSNKVYLLDSNAKLIPGFPIYGRSQISLSNVDNRGRLEFCVLGEENSILLYQLE